MIKLAILVLAIFLVFDFSYAFDYPWMYYLPYGETVILKPLFKNESEVISIDSCKWLTPKQLIITADSTNYDIERYKLDAEKCELTIFNNQHDTNGVYHCIVNDFYISKAMLNVHGAPKATVLEEFTPNLIAGFAAAGGFL
jgi:hypothetical protein